MTCTDPAANEAGADGGVTTGTAPRLSQPVLPLARTGVDRAAVHRTDEPWLAAAWSHPQTRVLLVCEGKVLVVDRQAPDGPGAELVLVPAFEAPAFETPVLEGAASAGAVPEGAGLAVALPEAGAEASSGASGLVTAGALGAGEVGERLFLGVDDAGVAYFALTVRTLPGRMDGAARQAGLREVALLLGDRDSGLLVHAVALDHWHRMNRFCARCGQPTVSMSAGHVRRCPACGGEHYPRTDPAVIMLVVDDEDRCLLGNHALWPQGRFSTLAGFVEPGESLEQAVRREVAEEVGVLVGDVRYQGSQPHPFPSSLMLGFLARGLTTEIEVDGEEMADARWFSRAELRDAVVSGEVIPPNEMSIARRLVELWYGEALPRPATARD